MTLKQCFATHVIHVVLFKLYFYLYLYPPCNMFFFQFFSCIPFSFFSFKCPITIIDHFLSYIFFFYMEAHFVMSSFKIFTLSLHSHAPFFFCQIFRTNQGLNKSTKKTSKRDNVVVLVLS